MTIKRTRDDRDSPSSGFRMPSLSYDTSKMKPLKEHRARMDEDSLLDILFRCFEEGSCLWTVKLLADQTQQPEAFLKDILNRIAVPIKKGKFRNYYMLRPEYRSKKVKADMKALEEQEQAEALESSKKVPQRALDGTLLDPNDSIRSKKNDDLSFEKALNEMGNSEGKSAQSNAPASTLLKDVGKTYYRYVDDPQKSKDDLELEFEDDTGF
ncbi:transcription factor TFIIF, subunit beta [Monocercomonoides exilis]|uniref:transcription factor TFIIF, subunit beta n=1 Tax=Monocercomonoides exilis TaxID=2049356 RepID=UPI00355964CA|nr:transcription factor TFIIF, subunit beta [Monocercomonoides exilis]|eukprot:MONOS_16857.1-p1 / transcript=MONOS_16857.1 / gene=MONOS_16857 / organism=Monocercomonoides_exilis_PA203 / gene_product=transcription factor TFIIF, subunit beta / transcript_product=transcription factor TFIIF, subunit beta / location=Mono_scaffold00543:9567-10317(-) / protein_length=211 / sequence_SO=supercontig / SO=protein_coding / is_pseudo=false